MADLQEELKRRESRWSAASTRSRQKIEVLEEQNKELQEEVKLLEHYRLQQWREEEQAKVRYTPSKTMWRYISCVWLYQDVSKSDRAE